MSCLSSIPGEQEVTSFWDGSVGILGGIVPQTGLEVTGPLELDSGCGLPRVSDCG